jgi:hypothetical protein
MARKRIDSMDRFEVIDNEKAVALGLAEVDKYDKYHFWWLVVENLPDGTKRIVGEDGGEPEDQLLVRDWKWVAPELNAAFKAGVEAERERCAKIAEGQRAYCHNDQTEECHGGHCDMAMAEAIARLIRESK